MRALRPFLSVLRRNPGSDDGILKTLDRLDLDARVPMFIANRMLERAEQMSGDPALGLKAGMQLDVGDLGAVDYAWSSAANVDQALEIAARCARLINDAMAFSREVVDGRVFVRLSNFSSLPRFATEFQLSAVLSMHKRIWPVELSRDLEVWLTGSQPADVSPYERAFALARVHFAASFSGFSFDARHLSAPLRSADANLHAVMRKHMELVLGTSPQLQSYTERVRTALIHRLPSGNAHAVDIARLLHTSSSTLRRRLEAEGTSFSAILEEVRRQLALGYLTSRELSMPELALLTGFSQPAAFHRAFRRWTGKTPLQYRRERRELRIAPRQRVQSPGR
jgi:AraC-like DNA-binding protein